MKKIVYAGLSISLCLSFALPVLAQQPAAAPTPAQLACNSKYGAYYAKQDDMALLNAFVGDATCKDSTYLEGAYQIMSQKLVAASNWKGAMDFAARFDKEMPNATAAGKGYVFGQGMTAAAQAGDADKIIEFGEKVLAVKSDDLNAIMFVSNTIPEKLPTDAALKDKALARAMELANKLIAMPRIQQVDEKTWQTSVVGPAHAVVGFVYLQKLQYADSATDYDQAVKINPKDQMSWYRYGLDEYYLAGAAQKLIQPAYDELNKPENRELGPARDALVAKRDEVEKDFADKRVKAMDVLGTAVAQGGEIGKAAKTNLDTLWKSAHDGALDGLDDFVAKHK